MIRFLRNQTFWILLSLFSLLVWIVRWLPESFVRFYNIVFISWDYYPRVLVRGSMYTVAAVGMVSRLLAVIFAILCIYIIWKRKNVPLKIRKILAISIGLEAAYYASLIPSILYLFALGWTRNSSFFSTLGFGYFLHVLFTFPLLAVFSIKLYRNKSMFDNFQSKNLFAVVFCGYIVALWVNVIFHWLGLALTQGLSFLWVDSTSLLAWNAIVIMTLAIVFAFFGGFYLLKRDKKSIKWMGFALVFVGLYYFIYLIYHAYIGALVSVWLIDVWAIAFLGLGLNILIKEKIQN